MLDLARKLEEVSGYAHKIAVDWDMDAMQRPYNRETKELAGKIAESLLDLSKEVIRQHIRNIHGT